MVLIVSDDKTDCGWGQKPQDVALQRLRRTAQGKDETKEQNRVKQPNLGAFMRFQDVEIVFSEDEGISQWVVKNYPLRGSARITAIDDSKRLIVPTIGSLKKKEVTREFPTLKAAINALRKWHNTNLSSNRSKINPFEILTQLGRNDKHPAQGFSPAIRT